MWYPFLVQQEFLAEKKRVFFLLTKSVLMTVPLAVSSALSQVQTVPYWQGLVQATVALPALLSQQAFLLLMFPTHAQNDLSAVGEQAAVLHESANLDAGADAQARQHSVHIPASWAVGYLWAVSYTHLTLPTILRV